MKRRWPSLDIRTRLWVALALLAFSTLFVGGIGWYALDRADNRLQLLHAQTLTEVARSLRLSKQSAALATSAPFLLNLKSSYLIQKEGRALMTSLAPILEEWPGAEVLPPDAETTALPVFNAEIGPAVRRMQAAIADLVLAAEAHATAREATQGINAELALLEDRFFGQMSSESSTMAGQRRWLALQTLTNELVGAGHAGNLLGVGERRRVFQRLERDFSFLRSSPPHLIWLQKLEALAFGEAGLFEVRRRELSRQLESQNALFRIRYNASLISDLAARFATDAEASLATQRLDTATSINFAKGLISAVLLISIAVALLAALYVSGYVTRNIHAISDAMARLAAGDRRTKLRLNLRENDEISKLHHSFRIFRANALRLDRSNRQLVQQIALFEKIFANISDGVAITSDAGSLTAINPHFSEVLHPNTKISGKTDIIDYLSQTGFSKAVARQNLSADFQGFTELDSLEGRVVEVRASRLPDGGAIWLFSDTTERRKMDSRLRQIQHIEGLSKVTGEVAHDFGNVLSAVGTNVHLLQIGSERVSQDELLRRISNALEIGSSLTQRLLAFARKQALAPEVVEINELIEGLADLVSIGLKDGVELDISRSEGPIFVKVDPGQLESAILNLCLNSNQAITDAGRISLSIRKGEGNTALITISDSGCGMDEAILSQAMEPFFSARFDGEGTGLGLSMVYGFIKQTGGDIKISSQRGQGTEVRLTLPRISADMALPPLLQKTALLVEDDPEALASTKAQLISSGFRVVSAATYEAAVHALETGDEFDAMVTDLQLNDGHSGWDLVEKCLGLSHHTRILVTSGRMPERHRFTTSPHPQVSCRPKPLNMEILRDALQGGAEIPARAAPKPAGSERV